MTMNDGQRLRLERLETRLRHRGLTGAHWAAVAKEVQVLRDLDDRAAAAHVAAYHEHFQALAAVSFTVPVAPPKVREPKPRRAIIEMLEIDNPEVTAGLLEGAAKGENPVTLRIDVPRNLSLVVGSFANVAERTALQTEAVARYRLVWERYAFAVGSGGGELGGAGAPCVEEGDILSRQADAYREYSAAVRALGMVKSRVVEMTACEGGSLRSAARLFFGGDGGAARERVEATLLEAAEVLIQHFGLVAGAGARRRLRSSGERPSGIPSAGVYERDGNALRRC